MNLFTSIEQKINLVYLIVINLFVYVSFILYYIYDVSDLLYLYLKMGSYVFLSRKVEQIAEEAESLKESLDKYNSRSQKRSREAKERAELLGRMVCHCYLLYLMARCVFFPLNLLTTLFAILEWGFISRFANFRWRCTSNAFSS